MSQRYVLANLNQSNLVNINNNVDNSFNKTVEYGSKKDLRGSMHSLSKTRTPTKLQSRISKDHLKMVPQDKYEELVRHYNQLANAQKLLKLERDQFSKGYNQLKFISQRQKTQLVQAFEQLKNNYIQVQNKCQQLAQQLKRTPPSSIEKLYSELQDTPPVSAIYTIKQQYYATLQENKNMKSQIGIIQKQLFDTRVSLDKVMKQKYSLTNRLQGFETNVKLGANQSSQNSQQITRQQIHQQNQQLYVLGLVSQKNINLEVTKVSLLLEQNINLIFWKQNLEVYYEKKINDLEIKILTLDTQIKSQQQQLKNKNKIISNLQTHLDAVTNENQIIQQRSQLIESQMKQIKNQATQIKQKASQQYKHKITQILNKAFNIEPLD